MSDSSQSIVHVYFMPGMAANPTIFEFIKLPKDQFEIHWLRWLIPKENENITQYSQRMNTFIKHDNVVLIGVSFGGVLVQEMSKFLSVKRVIIISSVKCRAELPRKMKFASKTGIYKILPVGLLDYIDYLEKIAINDYLKKRAKLYRQYLSVRDKRYLTWAIQNMVNWDCETQDPDLIHIHGDSDEIFPIKNIKNAIIVKGGTHVMILNRFRWFNTHLPQLILNGKLAEKENNLE
ncbi:alpha/beta hydrolase [Zunongwangia sp.]|uniref:alpha/beta hydrolase n=1 Tax=Zunongwangia sp. TaxID=1965325 RepID=UPI003AA8F17D